MKKILLASGCSFTDKNFTSDFHHNLDTSWPKWPELLAKKLDMDCINLAMCGAGNEYIYTSLLNQIMKMNPSDIGLIMPAWSNSQRIDWSIRGGWRNLNQLTDPLNEGDIQYHIQRSIIYYYSLQEICKNNNWPLKQFQMLPVFRGYDWDPTTKMYKDGREKNYKILLKNMYDSPYYNKLDDSFLGWPTENKLGGFNIKMNVLKGYEKESYQYAVSEIDNHPNAKGQKIIAEFLYDRLG